MVEGEFRNVCAEVDDLGEDELENGLNELTGNQAVGLADDAVRETDTDVPCCGTDVCFAHTEYASSDRSDGRRNEKLEIAFRNDSGTRILVHGKPLNRCGRVGYESNGTCFWHIGTGGEGNAIVHSIDGDVGRFCAWRGIKTSIDNEVVYFEDGCDLLTTEGDIITNNYGCHDASVRYGWVSVGGSWCWESPRLLLVFVIDALALQTKRVKLTFGLSVCQWQGQSACSSLDTMDRWRFWECTWGLLVQELAPSDR